MCRVFVVVSLFVVLLLSFVWGFWGVFFGEWLFFVVVFFVAFLFCFVFDVLCFLCVGFVCV